MSPKAPVTEFSAEDAARKRIETTADASEGAASGRERVGEVLEGRYSLVRKIDEGGMGVVYEARHLKLDRRVAVKVMDAKGALAPTRLERFQREAQSLARFHSPYVVSAIDFGTTADGVPFLVMDYLDGQDLRRILNELTSLPLERTLKLVGDAIKGVQAAHREGYVHRDLKPENLFVTRNVDGSEHCRVLDFGIVKVPGASTLTADGGSVGTAGYMAPEQVRGEKEPDVRMDVFALGAILYECLTGQRAIRGRSVEDVLLRTMRGEIPNIDSMPNVPHPLRTVVAKALAFEPRARYQSASELGAALQGVVFAEGVVNPRSPMHRNRRYAFFALLFAVVVTAASNLWVARDEKPSDLGVEVVAVPARPENAESSGTPTERLTLEQVTASVTAATSASEPQVAAAATAASAGPGPPPVAPSSVVGSSQPHDTRPGSSRRRHRSRAVSETTSGLELEDNPY